MNLNKLKIDFYKYFKIIMIVLAVIILVGVVLICTVGFNLSTDYFGGGVFMFGTLSGIIALVLLLVYVGIRYGWTKAFSTIFNCVVNVLVLSSIVLIIRIDVSDGFIMSVNFTIILTALSNMLLLSFRKKNEENIDVNFAEVTNNIIEQKLKLILIVYAVLMLVCISLFAIPAPSSLDLMRTLLVAVVVTFLSTLFVTIPLFWFVFKRMNNLPKKRKNKEEIDQVNN